MDDIQPTIFPSTFRPAIGECRWDGVVEHAYKEDGSAPFKAITRQTLFGDPRLACELRYFEIAPGGYSTLERHNHVHAVVILRGHGMCLVGQTVRPVRSQDLVSIPPMAWHQFRAAADTALGFLCMVDHARDRPQLPNEEELTVLRHDPAIAAFLAD
jgi:quercetin dioxygenase-like cupin family protein